MLRIINKFLTTSKGVVAIEYGLIALFIALMIITVFSGESSFVVQLQNKFADLTVLFLKAVQF